MQIRTGFFIEDQWTGVRGRVIETPADASGDYLVVTRSGVKKVQGFNANVLSYITPQIGDLVNVTNGTQNFTGRIIRALDNGAFEMELTGLYGTVAVHVSQMYQVVARANALAVAS